MLTDIEITNLIECKKRIVVPPKKSMTLQSGHFKNDMEIESLDKEHKFRVFMRKCSTFHENFTIGLDYISNSIPNSIILFRCNGMHGNHHNDWSNPNIEHHSHYHIHIAKEENIVNNLKPERYAEITGEYSTFDDALEYFLKKCNIIDKNNYFYKYNQISIFEDVK